ncbi:hypothetical protein B2J93_3973 [Marssonina coronariae]|uniref:Ammonium transporter AmtB-like domain-containing protein n=1 Tax=Diplocarpon coronariae TaxID=2795749 RepID=A0A218YV20_9HELO|nr:hypothetical protein B2J93_3973 [Marssonina coronariae]
MVFPALFLSCACGLQFWFYVPSLYQARTAGHIIDDTSLVGLRDVLAQPSVANSGIPHILYAASGFTSVTATAMILAGSMLERERLRLSLLFLLCWTTFDCYFLAEWNPEGWLLQLGVYDYAGSGASATNLSLCSIYVVINTNFAACGGGIAWAALDYAFECQFSIFGLCSSIIAGLVGVTPAAGLVYAHVSVLVGAVTATCRVLATRHMHFISIDDGLEIFAIHGVGGYVGDVLTGFFATSFVPALDGISGSSYTDCWWNEHWRQVGYRLAAATMCAAWSFAISCPAVHYQQDPRMPGQS